MYPLEFAKGTARWQWRDQPPQVLNPFGTIQGGLVGVFIDELFTTAIGSVLEDGEWATTAEMKVSYLLAGSGHDPRLGSCGAPIALGGVPGGAGHRRERRAVYDGIVHLGHPTPAEPLVFAFR